MLHVHDSFPDSSSRVKRHRETLPPIQYIYLSVKNMTTYTHWYLILLSDIFHYALYSPQNKAKQPTSPKFSSFLSLSCLFPELHIVVSENTGVDESKHQKDALHYWQQGTSHFILFKLMSPTLTHTGESLYLVPLVHQNQPKLYLFKNKKRPAISLCFLVLNVKVELWNQLMIQNKENPIHMSINWLMGRFFTKHVGMHEKYGDESSFSAVCLLYEMPSSANYTSCEKHFESLFGITLLSHS